MIRKQSQTQDPCIRCRSLEVYTDTAAGDVICRACGEIQADRIIDERQEWRDFDDAGENLNRARASCQQDRVIGTTSTYFVGGPSEAGCKLLAKYQILTTEKTELQLVKVAELIADVGSKLNLTRRILVMLRFPSLPSTCISSSLLLDGLSLSCHFLPPHNIRLAISRCYNQASPLTLSIIIPKIVGCTGLTIYLTFQVMNKCWYILQRGMERTALSARNRNFYIYSRWLIQRRTGNTEKNNCMKTNRLTFPLSRFFCYLTCRTVRIACATGPSLSTQALRRHGKKALTSWPLRWCRWLVGWGATHGPSKRYQP